MTIKALLLDAGGTLLTESPSREAIYARIASQQGLSLSVEEMRQCMGRAHAALPRIIAGNYRYSIPWFEAFIADIFTRQLGLSPAALPPIQARLFAAFADPANFRLLPGAGELLEQASARGLELGLVSNWSPALTSVIAGLGVLERFDALLISSIERVEKPDPVIFERALARLNVSAAEALHVGNDPVQDVRGASDCGIRALLFDPQSRHAALSLASIRALDEIIPWIEDRR